jgi:cell division control protein 12
MYDLIQATEDDHLEYRASKLKSSGIMHDAPGEFASRKAIMDKMKQDEDALVKRFTEQAKLEELRFRKWGQNVGRCIQADP